MINKFFSLHSTLIVSALFLSAVFMMSACKKRPVPATQAPAPETTENSAEPKHIVVQHILIGFKDPKLPGGSSIPGKSPKLTMEEAAKLAEKVYAQAQVPNADFGKLVTQYTDDQSPGIYGMANEGVTPEGDEFPRHRMVPAFGDVGFKLKVGEVGLAPYSKDKSPFGFHIIKRLK